jgi:hypothetical protein
MIWIESRGHARTATAAATEHYRQLRRQLRRQQNTTGNCGCNRTLPATAAATEHYRPGALGGAARGCGQPRELPLGLTSRTKGSTGCFGLRGLGGSLVLARKCVFAGRHLLSKAICNRHPFWPRGAVTPLAAIRPIRPIRLIRTNFRSFCLPERHFRNCPKPQAAPPRAPGR